MKKVFLSGISGTGMSALAGLFKQKGFIVEGSDSDFYPPIGDILRKMKVKLYKGYNVKNITDDIDFFILGNILSRGNPEVEYVLNKRLKFYSMSEALYDFFINDKYSVVVSGTHGKTTTSSFISFMLKNSGLNPSFFIGGKAFDLGKNYEYDNKGDYFIVEGDEYETSFFDRSSKFLKYFPYYLIITSLEYDHADFFKNEDLYLYSFSNLVNQVPSNGFIVVNYDYDLVRKAVSKSFSPVYSFSMFEERADYFIFDVNFNGSGYDFKLKYNDDIFEFKTSVLGKYNVYNFVSGIIFGLNIGISYNKIYKSVLNFKGVERRMNLIKNTSNSVFVEDFAHHPTSIKLSLNSLREEFKNYNLICVLFPASNSLKSDVFEDELIESLLVSDETIIIKPIFRKNTKLNKLDLLKVRKQVEAKGKRIFMIDKLENLKSKINEYDLNKKNLFVLFSNSRRISDFI